MLDQNTTDLIYLLAAVLFILDLKWMAHPRTAVRGNIVGAIANESGLNGRSIGRIQIFDSHSLVDLPQGMPEDVPRHELFGYSPGGALKVSYQVSTEGAAEIFWDEHYSGPDAALNLPHRIVRIQQPDGSALYALGTDQSRNRMKGFFVRDGEGIDPARPKAKTSRATSVS